MNKKIKKITAALGMGIFLFGVALTASAQSGTPTNNAARGIISLVQDIQDIIGALIPAMMGLAIVAFFWGIILYMFTKKQEEGRSFMLWGIIAIFVMSSVWGIVGLLRGTFFGSGTQNYDYDSVKFSPVD
jgi:mannose/fructose/N-acetylgalactosamine-specific phosphotransferase system component IID